MPIAGDDASAIEIASGLVRDVGYEPVLVGTLAAMGKYLIGRDGKAVASFESAVEPRDKRLLGEIEKRLAAK